MPARPPKKILEDMINGQGKGAKSKRKFSANKQRNWLLAITLNSLAKLHENAQLTDVETGIVDAVRKNGFKDDEMKLHGKLFRSMPKNLKDDIFPGKFASLGKDTKYTKDDLKKDAPSIV